MWAVRRFHRQLLKPLPLLHNREILLEGPQHVGKRVSEPKYSSTWTNGFRFMSTTKGRSMRSKVEKRMQRETGKTFREVRRAKKLRKKLMTEEERLIYNLRRAKKKVALLLQKLKKYELPELPAPVHDPELLTAEQLQAYKKIGFRNRNYVPVGIRGVFGGVVQNMHLHWKFHETVQVCCDNFPKEKIREMATMLARLSGGIVVNIHNVKTIIMFRGRNYRQPKNLIPINTLTKRKALFKARFEQALDSQKLNIKKIEQMLRRKGVNPEDPIAMASIQRVASTFFRAIDEKQGTPYVFHGDHNQPDNDSHLDDNDDPNQPTADLAPEDSDQEDLDRFIAEIEDAADQEWAAEEAAEREEMSTIRYLGKEGKDEMAMVRGRSPNWRNFDSEENQRNDGNKLRTMNIRKWDSADEMSENDDSDESDNDVDDRGTRRNKRSTITVKKWDREDENSGLSDNEELDSDNEMNNRKSHRNERRSMNPTKWDHDNEMNKRRSYTSEQRSMNPRKWDHDNEEFNDSDEDDNSSNMMVMSARKKNHEDRDIISESDDEMFVGGSDDDAMWRSDSEEEESGPKTSKVRTYDYQSESNDDDEENVIGRNKNITGDDSRKSKKLDENWDSD